MIPNLTFVVTFRDGHGSIEKTLDSLPSDSPVIVVDDMSITPYRTERPNVKVIRRPTRGYPAGACNTGMQACDTDVVLLGQDNALGGDAWKALLAKRDQYATIGDGVFGHPAWPKGYVQATWMFMRRDAIKKVGGFNARDYPAWGCTAEWQLRVCRAGFKALPVAVPGLSHTRHDVHFGDSLRKAMAEEPKKRGLFLQTPPAISVVICCFNYGRFLADAVHSLLGGKTSLGEFPPQSFQSFEVIIVDDASTDNSLELAQALADDWKGVRVYRNAQNVGTAETLNAGVRHAYGRYVGVLSADDMMEPTRLEKLYRVVEANPHRAAYDDVRVFKRGSRAEAMPMMEPYNFDRLLQKNMISYGQLYPRKAWAEAGGYPSIFGNGREDWAFNVALGKAGYCGIHVREALLLYRREGHNRSLANSSPDWRAQYVGKMHATFPDLYRGDRPAMCCGNKLKNQAPVRRGRGAPAPVPMALPGAAGMTLLEFLGNTQGPMQFTGPVSRTAYMFGGLRVTGYVDQRDVDGLLDMYHHTRPLFRLAATPKPPIAATLPVAPKVEAAPKVAAATAVVEEHVQLKESAPIDIPTMTAVTDSDISAEKRPAPEPDPLVVFDASTGEPPKPKRSRRKKESDVVSP